VLVSSTHVTYFGHYSPSSGIKYMLFKTQNKMNTDEGWNFNSGNYLFTTDTK